MSRLLEDHLQQHSTSGVLLYDQIGSVTLVDAKWKQSVQTPNPVALNGVSLFEKEGDAFLNRIITTDKTWLFYYDPETKQQSSQWKSSDSPLQRRQGCPDPWEYTCS